MGGDRRNVWTGRKRGVCGGPCSLKHCGGRCKIKMVMRVCLVGLIMAVCVQEVTGSTMGGGDDRWYVVRRRCECEIVAAATVACKLGADAISGWKDRGQLGRNGRGVDRR